MAPGIILKPVTLRPFDELGSLDLNGLEQSVPARGCYRRVGYGSLGDLAHEREGSQWV